MTKSSTLTALALAALVVGCSAGPDRTTPASNTAPALKPYREELAGTTLAVEMVPVVPTNGGKPFYIAKLETSWELYDTFVFGFDQQQPGGSSAEADAVTRPSKPYISMDRGFGHAGYPAISCSYLGAKKFGEWLSAKTGKTYRVPTLEEWTSACELAALPANARSEYAWSKENSDGTTHALGTSKADALGCHDLLGNASEWCTMEDASDPRQVTVRGVTIGGTFRDPAENLGCAAIVPYSPNWNASDPQFPKSKWWLADGGFVGFRVVCEVK